MTDEQALAECVLSGMTISHDDSHIQLYGEDGWPLAHMPIGYCRSVISSYCPLPRYTVDAALYHYARRHGLLKRISRRRRQR